MNSWSQYFLALFVIVAITAVLTHPAIAGGGPENVLLVVNVDSHSSKTIANHYIKLRNIPPTNVLYLNNVPVEDMTWAPPFEKDVMKPILSYIEQQKLTNTIDYIVYSSGFPTAVSNSADYFAFLKDYEDQHGKQAATNIAKFVMARASITSLTYFADQDLSGDNRYMAFDANKYIRAKLHPSQVENIVLKAPFLGQQQDQLESAVSMLKKNETARAIEVLMELGEANPRQAAVFYWLARAYAQDRSYVQAAEYLRRAGEKGWSFQSFTQQDPFFETANQQADFRLVVQELADESYLPTIGFDRQDRWSGNGFPNATAGTGFQYYLSSMLGVTSENGCTDDQVIDNLRQTCQLDGTQPEGTFYFAKTADVRTQTRAGNFDDAIKILNSLGKKTEIITDALPKNKRDVLGLVCGTPSFVWADTRSQMIPGAICDNLTSAGGAFTDRTQTKLTEFMKYGAAGAIGTVIEPYAMQVKFPLPMWQAHYVRGASLAESYYQSVACPFQLLLVGDPLCQPFAVKPKFSVTGLKPMETVAGALDVKIDFQESPVEISRMQVFFDGQLITDRSPSNNLKLETDDIADGFHEMRIVGRADSLIGSVQSQIIPFFVSNSGGVVKLTTRAKRYGYADDIRFTVKTQVGTDIQFRQNSRSIPAKSTGNGKYVIAAKEFGNGPVAVTAEAVDRNNRRVSSAPLELDIGR